MDKITHTKMSDQIHSDMDTVNEAVYIIKDTIANSWGIHPVGIQAEKVIVELRLLREKLYALHKEICGE
jgi:hypothetical protein|tara:strand:- start:283 stop:489 length:207 start_codon:yes stop_codon:yes gene_type:complete